MTEGRAVQVKSNADRIGLFFPFHPFQNVQKAENGMGEKPLLVGEGLDSKKGTIYDGVTVKNH
jgi:hypothetical protein